jgi:hypothetical protein
MEVLKMMSLISQGKFPAACGERNIAPVKIPRCLRRGASFCRLGLLLLIVFLVSACSLGRLAVPKDELNKPHNVLVIPYKANPIKVNVETPLLAIIAFGGLGIAIHQAVTSDERGKVAEYLNKSGGDWNPSMATAEECLKILNKDAKGYIASTTIGKITELPGVENLRKEEPRTFTEGKNWSYDWEKIWNDYRNTNTSLIKYKNENPKISPDWSLEMFNFLVSFTDEHMWYCLYVKLMNSITNEKIAAGMAKNEYPIPTLQEGFDFNAFDQIFRGVAQKACTSAMVEMGLIAY